MGKPFRQKFVFVKALNRRVTIAGFTDLPSIVAQALLSRVFYWSNMFKNYRVGNDRKLNILDVPKEAKKYYRSLFDYMNRNTKNRFYKYTTPLNLVN